MSEGSTELLLIELLRMHDIEMVGKARTGNRG